MNHPPHTVYYSAAQVSADNVESDCWVSLFGKVLDLTPLLAQNRSSLAQPIVRVAGTDITHWFQVETKQVRVTETVGEGSE
jgi:hypothetical protein